MRQRKIGQMSVVRIKLEIDIISKACHTAQEVSVADQCALWWPCGSTGEGESSAIIEADLNLRSCRELISFGRKSPEIKAIKSSGFDFCNMLGIQNIERY